MYFHIDLQFFPVLTWDCELSNNLIKSSVDRCNLNMQMRTRILLQELNFLSFE